ncbi:conjugal transfer protein TraF [Metallibacterium scheffleri]|nr:conjugal transfer protein TraF [Metallibacterium scheffleri]
MVLKWLLIPAMVAVGAMLAPHAIAQIDRRPHGWIWYTPTPQPSRPVKQTTSEPGTEAAAKLAGPSQWSTAWIREKLPRLRDLAIQDPSEKNVRAYLLLQHLAMDRAQRFAEVSMMVTQGDPTLDENTRFPLASAAAQAGVESAKQGLVSAIQVLAKTTGLYFFFSSTCEYCHADLPVLRTFELESGMKIVGVSLDGQPIDNQLFPNYLINSDQAQRLGVQYTPAFFLVHPPNLSDVVQIGQGYLSLQQLEQRIVEEAYYHGWLSPATYRETRIASPLYQAGVSPRDQHTLSSKDAALITSVVGSLPPRDHNGRTLGTPTSYSGLDGASPNADPQESHVPQMTE